MSLYTSKDKLSYFKDNVQTSDDQGQGSDRNQHGYATSTSFNSGNFASGVNSLSSQQLLLQQQRQRAGGQPVAAVGNTNANMGSSPDTNQQYLGNLARASYNSQQVIGASGGSVGSVGLYGRGVGEGAGGMAVTSVAGALNGGVSQRSGSDGGIQFDSSSFPVLSSNTVSLTNNNRFQQALTQGPASSRDDDFTIANEDFPALPGSQGGGGVKGDSGVVGGSSFSHGGVSSGQLGNTMMGFTDLSHDGIDGLAAASPNSPGGSVGIGSGSAGGSTGGGGMETAARKDSRFGMAGLLDVIRMTDKDLNALALGSDLTTFGLNLNSVDCLYSSFSSPFADAPAPTDTAFSTPPCYLLQPPGLKAEHLSKFLLETLFYMFYAMPRDVLQAIAAQELYRREWRYHGELRLWLKPRSPQELMQNHPNVQFLCFDVTLWESKLFTSNFRGNIATGLLSEEDVRVKALQQQQQPPQSSAP